MSDPQKSNGKPRQLTIHLNYHFTSAGRRPGIRKDIVELAMKALIRRLEKHSIVIDSFEVVENDKVTLGA